MFTSGQVTNPRTVFVMFLSQLRKRNLLSSAEFEFTVTRLWSSILQITLICNQGAIHRFLGYPVLLRYVYTLRCMSRILALIKITADATQFLFDFVQITAKSVKRNYLTRVCSITFARLRILHDKSQPVDMFSCEKRNLCCFDQDFKN